MKKLKKLSLEKLEQEMPVIEKEEQNKYIGGYELIGSWDPSYNCHSYAWNNCGGWIEDPIEFIDSGDYCQKSGDFQSGDKAVYYVDTDNDGCYDRGEPIVHSALVDSGNGTNSVLGLTLTSKWGATGVYRHTTWDVPGDYSVTIYNGHPVMTKVAVLSN